MEAFDNSHFCTRLLEFVTLITLMASFLQWHASLIEKKKKTHQILWLPVVVSELQV